MARPKIWRRAFSDGAHRSVGKLIANRVVILVPIRVGRRSGPEMIITLRLEMLEGLLNFDCPEEGVGAARKRAARGARGP